MTFSIFILTSIILHVIINCTPVIISYSSCAFPVVGKHSHTSISCMCMQHVACKDCRAGSTSTDHMCAVETNKHLNRQVDLQEDGESWLRVSQTSWARHNSAATPHWFKLKLSKFHFDEMKYLLNKISKITNKRSKWKRKAPGSIA